MVDNIHQDGDRAGEGCGGHLPHPYPLLILPFAVVVVVVGAVSQKH